MSKNSISGFHTVRNRQRFFTSCPGKGMYGLRNMEPNKNIKLGSLLYLLYAGSMRVLVMLFKPVPCFPEGAIAKSANYQKFARKKLNKAQLNFYKDPRRKSGRPALSRDDCSARHADEGAVQQRPAHTQVRRLHGQDIPQVQVALHDEGRAGRHPFRRHTQGHHHR
jgi:hypothetical protein